MKRLIALLSLALLVVFVSCRKPRRIDRAPLRVIESPIAPNLIKAFQVPDALRDPSRIRANGKQLLLVDASDSTLAGLEESGELKWMQDLKKACQCRFCGEIAVAQSRELAVLDMAQAQLCILGADGTQISKARIEGGAIPSHIASTPLGLYINDLQAEVPYGSYSIEGKRLHTFNISLKNDTARDRSAQLFFVEGVWVFVFMYSGDVATLAANGEDETYLSNPEAGNPQWPILRECAAANSGALICIRGAEYGKPSLRVIEPQKGLATDYPLPIELRSITDWAGETAGLESTGRSVWVIQTP